jgi:hypothetical protein
MPMATMSTTTTAPMTLGIFIFSSPMITGSSTKVRRTAIMKGRTTDAVIFNAPMANMSAMKPRRNRFILAKLALRYLSSGIV